MAADVLKLGARAIIADAEDWGPELHAACARVGALEIAISKHDAAGVTSVAGAAGPGESEDRGRSAATAFELLSSGTTGPPKRSPLSWSAVESAVRDAAVSYAGSGTRNAPVLMVHPMGNVAGLGYLAPALAHRQPIVLLEKFEVADWVSAVRTYRPVRAALPAPAVQMVLDSKATRDDLASLSLVAVGGARIEPELQRRFEEVFGIPVLTAFGATEFGGVVANWSLDLYRRFGAVKRGSAGKPSPGVALRVVDRESHERLPADQIGLLEARVDRIGPDWIRTNDLASLDADGFLYLHGRADDAINRGGFKVVPESVVRALREHPAIADAAVVGIPDDRLGEVPVAAIELKPGAAPPTDAAVKEFLRARLVAYQVPVAVRTVAALPRNASMKVSLPDVKRLFAAVQTPQ
jgi:acyl-coenzyme A synthetase/AMP-(fatty) acid ligase